METMKNVASYISSRYAKTYGENIDEMKLHKLMYFAQREALIQIDKPLFDAEFSGWRYGPVLKELRELYKEGTLTRDEIPALDPQFLSVMDTLFADYAGKESTSLSRLSHAEICWRISRKGIAPSEKGDVAIPLENIRLDAQRMKQRRDALSQYGM